MIIWDQKRTPINNKDILFWSGYSKKKPDKYILSLVELNSIKYRNILLDVTDFFYSSIFDEKLKEVEKLINQMSLLAERNIYKDDSFLNAVKLIALEEVLIKRKILDIKYFGNDRFLAKSLGLLAKKNNIKFQWKKSINQLKSLKDIIRIISRNYLPAIFIIIKYFYNFFKMPKVFSPKDKYFGEITFFSYFFNIDIDKISKGIFHSNQWNILPNLASKHSKSLNWFHLFVPSPKVLHQNKAIKYINTLNKTKKNQDSHSLLESSIDLKILFSISFLFLKNMLFKNKNKKNIYSKISYHNKSYLWPLFQISWEKSLFGSVYVNNLAYIFCLKKILSEIPYQKKGIYLLENKGWERALVYYWKKNKHGTLIGMQHSSVNPWFLSYFDNPINLKNSQIKKLPKPDIIAINGEHAWSTLKKGKQDSKLFRRSEAVRYLYLSELRTKKINNKTQNKIKKLLILGDIVVSSTIKMLEIILPEIKKELKGFDVIFKSHPQNNIKIDPKYQNLLTISEENLNKIVLDVDYVICSVNTSSALECCYIGLKVISFIDDYNLNASPLYDIKDSCFFNNKEEFIDIFKETVLNNVDEQKNIKSFFWLNNNMDLWKDILNDEK